MGQENLQGFRSFSDRKQNLLAAHHLNRLKRKEQMRRIRWRVKRVAPFLPLNSGQEYRPLLPPYQTTDDKLRHDQEITHRRGKQHSSVLADASAIPAVRVAYQSYRMPEETIDRELANILKPESDQVVFTKGEETKQAAQDDLVQRLSHFSTEEYLGVVSTVTQALSGQKDITDRHIEDTIETVLTNILQERRYSRRKVLVGTAKALLIAGFLSVMGGLRKVGAYQFVSDVMHESKCDADSARFNYNPNTMENRALFAVGDSDATWSDNEARDCPSIIFKAQYAQEMMRKRGKKVNWQVFVVAKNGAEGDEVRQQLQYPLFQIALGKKLQYDYIAKHHRALLYASDGSKREMRALLTENSHSGLKPFLERKNPDKKLEYGKLYSFTIDSQQDIIELEDILSLTQELDVDLSTGGNRIINYVMNDPGRRQEFETARACSTTRQGVIDIIKLIIGIETERRQLIRQDMTNFLGDIQTINQKSLRKIKHVDIMKPPDPSQQQTLSVEQPHGGYKSEQIPHTEAFSLIAGAAPRTVNNAETEAIANFDLVYGRSKNFEVIRSQAPNGRDDLYQQHFTEHGYMTTALNWAKRSLLGGSSFERLYPFKNSKFYRDWYRGWVSEQIAIQQQRIKMQEEKRNRPLPPQVEECSN